MEEQNLDGLVLAQAGLERLGLTSRISEILSTDWMLPAVGQGALGLECRHEDMGTRNLLKKLDDGPSHDAVLAERAFLRRLGGGCSFPVGTVTHVNHGSLELRGVVLRVDGSERLEGTVRGASSQAEELGIGLADQLLARGADTFLEGRQVINPL
jgi:hydroxymethylbilane synthase